MSSNVAHTWTCPLAEVAMVALAIYIFTATLWLRFQSVAAACTVFPTARRGIAPRTAC